MATAVNGKSSKQRRGRLTIVTIQRLAIRLQRSCSVLTVPTVGLVCVIAAGAVLRLIWLNDIEYKNDEDYSTYYALGLDHSERFPPVGMPSSTGIPNFGLSVWWFVILGRVFGVQNPPELARGVAVCSILAMALYLPFIRWLVSEREREAWHWGVALMALNPLAVLLHRKIWPPELFPLLMLAVLGGWMRRQRALGAFVFGVFGAMLGQVELDGFLLAAAFVAWARLFDRLSMRWRWWLAGSLVGSVPMVPWMVRMYETPWYLAIEGGPVWMEPLKGMFWIRWFLQPWGLNTLNVSLGSDFVDFLRYPLLSGQPTFLVGILHAFLAIQFLIVGVARAGQWWRQRRDWPAMFVGRSSATAFTLAAAFWGFGVLFALTGQPFRYHYLQVTMPLMFVWLARAMLNLDGAFWRLSLTLTPRRCLLALCIAQGVISLTFVDYIHTNPRRIRGDYGVPYGAQAPHPPIGSMSGERRLARPVMPE